MIKRILVMLCLLFIVSLVILPQTAMAVTTMKITNGNLTILNSFPLSAYGADNKLKFTYGKKLVTYGAQWKKTSVPTSNGYLKIGDGECVSAVEALSNVYKVTSSWVKANRVTAGGVVPGTVLATFMAPGDKYWGHTVIFRKYLMSDGKITGIEVWDQNWSYPTRDGMFRKHSFPRKTTRDPKDLGDAYNYYVVKY